MTSIEAEQQQQQHDAALADAMASEDSEDDEDFVPESLRNFLDDADRELDKQIDFILDSNTHAADPIPEGQNHFFNEQDDDDDQDPNSSMLNQMLQSTELQISQLQQQKKQDQDQDQDQVQHSQNNPQNEDDVNEDKNTTTPGSDEKRSGLTAEPNLLDIIHPTSSSSIPLGEGTTSGFPHEITDSDVKQYMKGAETASIDDDYDDDDDDKIVAGYSPDENQRSGSGDNNGHIAHSLSVATKTTPHSGADIRSTTNPNISTASASSSSSSLSQEVSTPAVGRKLQDQLDLEAKRASLSTSKARKKATLSSSTSPASTPSSSVGPSGGLRRRRNNQVAPIGAGPTSSTSASSTSRFHDSTERVVIQHTGTLAPSSGNIGDKQDSTFDNNLLSAMQSSDIIRDKQERGVEATTKSGEAGTRFLSRFMAAGMKKSGTVATTSSAQRSRPSLSEQKQQQQQQPKPFKARPAPTQPKPKEIQIPSAATPNGGKLHDKTPSDVSPLGGISMADGDQKVTEMKKQGVSESSTDTGRMQSPGRRQLTKPDPGLARLTKPTTSSSRHTAIATAHTSSSPSSKDVSKQTQRIHQFTNATKSKRKTVVSNRSNGSTSRLFKPTASVMARRQQVQENTTSGTSALASTSSLEDRSKKESVGTGGGRSSALAASRNKARLRAQLEAKKRKDRLAQENKSKLDRFKEADQRNRESQERLKRIEEERLATLREKINAKHSRSRPPTNHANKSDPKKNKSGEQKETIRHRTQRLAHRKAPNRVKPSQTVPVTPKFATDRRLHRTELPPKDKTIEVLPLARSSDVLMRGLRGPIPKRLQATSFEGKKQLTIPNTPNFETSKRHPGTKPTPNSPSRKAMADDMSWSSSLRDTVVSPISKAGSTAGGSLTVPEGPKFQPIRKRALPKSTEEREKEEMDYFNSHPFRARPPAQFRPSSSKMTRRSVATKPLTTPEPFKFRLDSRATTGHVRKKGASDDGTLADKNTRSTGFKARPMPQYRTARRKTPSIGQKTTKRVLTTPEPFHFQTDNRASSYTPQLSGQSATSVGGTAPSGSAGVPFRRRVSVSQEPEQFKPFKARPMPNFIPKSVEVKGRDGSPQKNSKKMTDDSDERAGAFRARKMPNFESVSIPVQHRLATQLRSQQLGRDDEEEEEYVPFHANPVPDYVFSPPKIPVKDRDPTKLRSPDSVKRPQRPPPIETGTPPRFHARTLPVSLTKDPQIPVVARDPTKLRSPESVKIPVKSPSRLKVKSPTALRASPPKIAVRERDPSKLRSAGTAKSPNTSTVKTESVLNHPRSSTKSSKHSASNLGIHSQSSARDKSVVDASMEGLMGVSPVQTPSLARDENRRRIKERIAARKKKGPTPVKKDSVAATTSSTAVTMKSPPAFASSKVKDKLSRGKEQLMEKVQNERSSKKKVHLKDVPGSSVKGVGVNSSVEEMVDDVLGSSSAVDVSVEEMVDDVLGTTLSLPLRSSEKKRSSSDAHTKSSENGMNGGGDTDAITPKIRNAPAGGRRIQTRPATGGSKASDRVMNDDELRRQVALACAMTTPDEDESDSVMQLAQEVQRLAEDELSFHGSSVQSGSP